jgi:hypothetical protein
MMPVAGLKGRIDNREFGKYFRLPKRELPRGK